MGHPLILVEAQPDRDEGGRRTAVEARVSSVDQAADLGRQVARVTAWAAEQGCAVSGVVTEIGSALNGGRRKGPHEACLVGTPQRFLALLRDPRWPPSWSSTEIAWPGSGPSTWKSRWPPRAGGWWCPSDGAVRGR